MSRWIYNFNDGHPFAVCEDIGEIKRFEAFPETDSLAVTNNIRIYGISGQLFFARFGARVILDGGFAFSEDYPEIINRLEDGMEIDEKNLLPKLYRLTVYCVDPRVLALVNGTIDLTISHRREHARLYSRIPSRETAIAYLEKNDYPWGKVLTRKEQAELLKKKKDRFDTPGDISILLD